MCAWALGEMYQSEEVCKVVPLLVRPERYDNLRFIGTWIMLAGASIFFLFWTVYLMLFAIFDDQLSLAFHALHEDVSD